MLTKSELTYLKGLKRFKDISREEIEDELINLISNQNGFKELKREIDLTKKRLQREELKIEKLDEELKRKTKQIFNLKHKINISKEGKETKARPTRVANVLQLKRILCLVKDAEKTMLKTEIYKLSGMIGQQGNSALDFLVHHNLIRKNSTGYLKCNL